MDKPQDPAAAETARITDSPAVDLPQLARLSSYVVMKAMHGLYTEHWDIHCVCADRKMAKIECDYRNARSRTNSYFVKRVPFLPNVNG